MTRQMINGIACLAITPVKVLFTDTVNCNNVGVRIIGDDCMSTATLYYELRDSDFIVHTNGNLTISGSDYTTWSGDNEYPFSYVASILGLTLEDVNLLPDPPAAPDPAPSGDTPTP